MEMTMVCTRSGIIRPLFSWYSTVTCSCINHLIVEGYNIILRISSMLAIGCIIHACTVLAMASKIHLHFF